MDYQDGVRQMLVGRSGTDRAAQKYHLDLMGDEDGEHCYSNEWSDCAGCRGDNPYVDRSGS